MIVCQVGATKVSALVRARGWQFSESRPPSAAQRAEMRKVQWSAIRADARAAFDAANEQRRREILAFQAFNIAHARRAAEQEITMNTQIQRMNQPLNESERAVCVRLGIDEAAYAEQRDAELAAELHNGLSDDEAKVCEALGMSYQDYAAQKALESE